MTEYQLVSNFNLFLISNAMFQLGVFILLWAALRGSLRIYDQGANIATKIISSLFGLGIVYNGLMVSGFFFINWQSTSYSLSQLDNLSSSAQRFVDFFTSNISTRIQFNSLESNTWGLVGSCCDSSTSTNMDKEIKIIKNSTNLFII